jgi:predicted glutamine amidotransferase
MCRFTLYLGKPILLSSLVTEPSHSLIHQSFHSHEREEPLNGDGFGIAWYAPSISPSPAAFRSLTPAWSNRNLLDLARVVQSPCILAHVRAATQQIQVSEANCHPFTRGRYAFMHNGDIGGFRELRRALLTELSAEAFDGIQGSTDSEHLFALLWDELRAAAADRPVDVMSRALRSAVARIVGLTRRYSPAEHSYLNVALTDGDSAVVCRFTTDDPDHADSLYLNQGRRYVCEDGLCRMIQPEDGHGAVLVSSEPLSEEPGWTKIPVNTLIRFGVGQDVEFEELMAA